MELAAERSYQTPVSNSTLLPLLLLSLARQQHTPKTALTFKDEYDYIIVGAGAGGSVVASRLSELPCVSVLLLEAGHEPPLLTEVPSLAKYFYNSDIDWKYITVPQLYTAAGLVNRQIPWAAGKMIGGSSCLNSMIYVRGNKKNFDDWERMGATGWCYNDVYPYFLKLEDNREPEFLANGYHSFGGPVSFELPRYHPELKDTVREAAESIGYQILDSNAARQTGFYDHEAFIRDNQRCSAAKAYLVPAENRTNLDIVPNAFVTKVLIESGQATGVQFDLGGQRYEVKATREVIVSAGAINTPQVLKLSGVGPKQELLSHNIPVVADLPVGQNLQNHGGVSYPFIINPFIPDFDAKLSDTENIYEYIGNRSGPLASNDAYLFTSFLNGLAINPVEDFPNYELYVIEMPISRIKTSGLKPEVYQQIYGPYEDYAIFTCSISEVQPKSRGTVTLQSGNPYDLPLLDPNYVADPEDVEDLVEGLKACSRLVSSEPFKRSGATPLQTKIPGCEQYADDEDEYFRCQVRTILFTFHHPAGTAKMGNPLDPTTVVDPELRVKNVKNLRVVDASVMPLVTSGNTNIPTIMIAEKASDMIKKNIKCFGSCPMTEEQPFESIIAPELLENIPDDASKSSAFEEEFNFKVSESLSGGLNFGVNVHSTFL